MKVILLRLRNQRVHKKLLLSLLLLPLILHAKSYEVTMSPCDMGTNCKKCYEVVKIIYTVDINSKQVIASGKDVNGKVIKEPIEKCQIADENNWNCDSAYLITQAKNGVITLTNRTESSMSRSKKEVCLVKQ
jgi:hypothetical protein